MDDINYDSDPYWNGGQRSSRTERVREYECQNCGYTPTRYELDSGVCPRCAEARRMAAALAEGVKP